VRGIKRLRSKFHALSSKVTESLKVGLFETQCRHTSVLRFHF